MIGSLAAKNNKTELEFNHYQRKVGTDKPPFYTIINFSKASQSFKPTFLLSWRLSPLDETTSCFSPIPLTKRTL